MCAYRIRHQSKSINTTVKLPSSKSITNRVLILNAVLKQLNKCEVALENISNADDSVLMQQALGSNQAEIYLKNAGTCMRFLTAFFAAIPNKKTTLSCDNRMKERPIEQLTDALIHLGAAINFIEKENHPPLTISGKELSGGVINLSSEKSSQFASALMLIAPLLNQPLTINLAGEIASYNYLQLTANSINTFGGKALVKGNNIKIENRLNPTITHYKIESDWSSAAFWFQIAALCINAQINLLDLNSNSLQGDSVVACFMKIFGVKVTVNQNDISLTKTQTLNSNQITINLLNYPDLAPALICTSAALQIPVKFVGLQTLQYKESNRLQAITTELNKLGYQFNCQHFELIFTVKKEAEENAILNTYNDHRLAMAFAPLCLIHPEIILDNIYVTEKSYPNYWEDLKMCGFEIEEI